MFGLHNLYPLSIRCLKLTSVDGSGPEDWSLELVLSLEESPVGNWLRRAVQVQNLIVLLHWPSQRLQLNISCNELKAKLLFQPQISTGEEVDEDDALTQPTSRCVSRQKPCLSYALMPPQAGRASPLWKAGALQGFSGGCGPSHGEMRLSPGHKKRVLWHMGTHTAWLEKHAPQPGPPRLRNTF